jgi:hypothetical protein
MTNDQMIVLRADFGFNKKLESLRQLSRKLLLNRCPPKQVSLKSQNPTDEAWH